MMDNYLQIIERISQSAGLSVEEIGRRVEAKRAKLSGLVSKEGAAQIVAAELGINFDKERLKISELIQGMKKANVLGKVVQIFPIRNYNKNGREGRIGSFLLADDSSNVKVVLWDSHHIDLIETGKLKAGDVIEVSNGQVRNGEMHLSSFSDMRASKEKVQNVVSERVAKEIKLKDVKAGQNMKSRAVIVQAFEPRYFEVCPECGKKTLDGQCIAHGSVSSKKRALLNLVLDDGTEIIRAIIVGENIKKLGFTDEEIFSPEVFSSKKDGILGEEKFFFGNARMNAMFNNLEIAIDDVENVEVNSLIKELEARR